MFFRYYEIVWTRFCKQCIVVLSVSTPVVNYYDTLDNIEFLSKNGPWKGEGWSSKIIWLLWSNVFGFLGLNHHQNPMAYWKSQTSVACCGGSYVSICVPNLGQDERVWTSHAFVNIAFGGGGSTDASSFSGTCPTWQSQRHASWHMLTCHCQLPDKVMIQRGLFLPEGFPANVSIEFIRIL